MALPNFSFELLPRTPEAQAKLPAVIAQLAAARPDYFLSPTARRLGPGRHLRNPPVGGRARRRRGRSSPHLRRLTRANIAVISIATRPQASSASWLCAEIYRHGYEPRRAGRAPLRQRTGQLHSRDAWRPLRIEVAAYPEMHPQAPSPGVDFENFRRKVEAGADGALTQLFYNADAYFHFMDRCARADITIPIVPGIMPITGHANTVRFCTGCGADLPRWVRLRLEELEHDKPALLDFGLEVVTRLCDAAQKRRARPSLLRHQPGRSHVALAGQFRAADYCIGRRSPTPLLRLHPIRIPEFWESFPNLA